MSTYISDVKQNLKEIFALYPKRREIKRIAYTANFNDLKDVPVSPSFNEISTSLVNFSGNALVSRDDGGKIIFRYRNGSNPTSVIRELNEKIEIDTKLLNVKKKLSVGEESTFNKITNNGDIILRNGDINVSDGKIKIFSTGAIEASGNITSRGYLYSSAISTGEMVSSGNLTLSGSISCAGNITSTSSNGTVKATNGNFTSVSSSSVTASGNINGKNITSSEKLYGKILEIESSMSAGSLNIAGTSTCSVLNATQRISSGDCTLSGSLGVSGSISSNSLTTNGINCGSGSITCGNISSSGTVTSRGFNSISADLAEKYESDNDYPVGTLIQFGGEKEITLATEEVNGVISEHPGYLLNSESKGLPVALCGKVKVLVKGKVKKFDKISSLGNGVGIVSNKNVIARALESKEYEDIGLVLCVTQFKL